MEIIHLVLGKANPSRMNGVNKVVSQLAQKQWEHGVNVSIWGISRDSIKNYGERYFETRLFKKQRSPFSFDSKLADAILSMKNKATFHIHGGWVPVFSTLAAFMNRHNISYVFTPHGAYNLVAMQRSNLRKKIYFYFFEKNLLKFAAKIHCIGQSEVFGLNSIFKNNKTVLLPYGYAAERYPLTEHVGEKDLIIGFVGRIDTYTKGLDLLVDAFAQLQKTVPTSKLWIVGDGPDRQSLEKRIAAKGLKETTCFFGSKFGSEKDELIKQMQVFVHPSRNEGLPAAVLEAASFGVPCIVSQATNLAQHVIEYNSGLTIQNENSKDLLKALLEIQNLRMSSGHISMRFNAQKMVLEAFGWDRLILQFSKLYAIK
jgi:glycosyltransferase involved in cell wall biosynthesis